MLCVSVRCSSSTLILYNVSSGGTFRYVPPLFFHAYPSLPTFYAVMDTLNKGATKSGRATFTKAGGKEGMDLYYGLHHFNWSRENIGGITISDYYNYGDG